MSVFPMPDLSIQGTDKMGAERRKKSCKKMAPVRSSFRGMILLGWKPGTRLLANCGLLPSPQPSSQAVHNGRTMLSAAVIFCCRRSQVRA